MTGVAYHYELDTAAAEAGLRALSYWQIERLAYNIGALLESATKERIAAGKTAPDGTPWAAWAPAYAETRGGAQSLLVGEGNLRDSVQNYSRGAEAIVGTNLVYGAVHQFGAEQGTFGQTGRGEPIPWGDIPARPYLGVSDEDRRGIEALVEGDLREVLA
ncbi:MAG: phage virion morphogenesis protein [Rhodovulum sp.]